MDERIGIVSVNSPDALVVCFFWAAQLSSPFLCLRPLLLLLLSTP